MYLQVHYYYLNCVFLKASLLLYYLVYLDCYERPDYQLICYWWVAIAEWIRLWLPDSSPEFESHAHHTRCFHFSRKKRKNTSNQWYSNTPNVHCTYLVDKVLQMKTQHPFITYLCKPVKIVLTFRVTYSIDFYC